MHVEIWHNPACGTSRNTLALIRDAGIEPVLVDYLAAPMDKARLAETINAAGLSVRAAMRSKQAIYETLGLDDPALTDDALLDAMLANRVLIQRPLVSSPLGTRMCRPAEQVLEILPR
jgi:arsenate reductase